MLLFEHHSHLLHFGSDPLCTHVIRLFRGSLAAILLHLKRKLVLVDENLIILGHLLKEGEEEVRIDSEGNG